MWLRHSNVSNTYTGQKHGFSRTKQNLMKYSGETTLCFSIKIQKSLDISNVICYFYKVFSGTIMTALDLITEFAERGKYHFTSQEAQLTLGSLPVSTRAGLRRLKSKGLIAMPYRGFYMIVPPEYRKLGCLPAEQFVPQLMAYLDIPYYGALLSAAQYHGAAHQRPQVFQVMVPKNRPPITCGNVRVQFVARKNIHKMPTRQVNTPRGYLLISSPEVTAVDLVGYVDHAGGLDNVATVLAELGEVLNAEDLVKTADLSPVPWIQRLGYLLDLVGFEKIAEILAKYLKGKITETTPLVTGTEIKNVRRNSRWRVAVNVEVEPDI